MISKINSIVNSLPAKKINIMEVCGTHTMAIASSGIKSILPENIDMLSGPGCPVCVTPAGIIDCAIELAKSRHLGSARSRHSAEVGSVRGSAKNDCIITTFGDMLRVPGSSSSLEKEKSNGCNIKIVYSCMQTIQIAKKNPDKEVVFIGVGFETTSPTIAATVKIAEKENIKNLSIIPAFKLIPPAIEVILKQKKVKIDGFLMPGHVSAIIGLKPYKFISEIFKIPAVVTGFEPDDILQGIFMLLKQIKSKTPKIETQYKRCVKETGNPYAVKLLYDVFEVTDSQWRGIGIINDSGLKFKKNYERFDALKKFRIKIKNIKEPTGCLCGKILTGNTKPCQCKYFGKKCTPLNPIGPCMVSSEGTCAAYYKYGKK